MAACKNTQPSMNAFPAWCFLMKNPPGIGGLHKTNNPTHADEHRSDFCNMYWLFAGSP